jgi:uncharacterized protein (TIGR03083 family)
VQITPRYDAGPIVRLDGPPAAIAVPLVRQRRRLAAFLSSLTPQQLARPSRCEGWRVQDVATHLAGVDVYWNVSIASGLSGTPTRLLAGFDPKATPAMMVAAKRDEPASDAVAACVAAIEGFCTTAESLDDAGWAAIAETPLGHVTVSALGHHALWDAWVHERDVLHPLGLVQEAHDDETVASLRYAAALSPAFALQVAPKSGALVLEATEPDVRVVVTVGTTVEVSAGAAPEGALVLSGRAVDLIEALSVRIPWGQPIPPESAWLVTALSEVFESAPA